MRTLHLASSLVISISMVATLALPHAVRAQVPGTTTTSIDPHNSADVEARVRQYFADIPAMAAVAKCESGFRQYDAAGNVLFDPSYSMIGVFQISSLHLPEAYDAGIDIMTLEGNMAYARHLYTQNGMDPWMASFGCWGSAVSAPTTAPTNNTTPLSSNLSFGMTSSAVRTLQQMLNQVGFVIASAGAGSPGNETTKFGSLTRDAVRRFQCTKGIICSGDESTTGYGLVDTRTYAALQGAAVGASTNNGSDTTDTSDSQAALDKAAQIAQVESQISSLTSQLQTLNQRLKQLTQ